MKIKSIRNIIVGTLAVTSYLCVYNLDTIIEGLQDSSEKVVIEEVIVEENETTSSVQEEQTVLQKYEEMKIFNEQRTKELEEKTKQEIASDSNFINKYNKIMEIYDDYYSFTSNRKYGNHYMAENHDKAEDEWIITWDKELKEIEVDKDSVLNELKASIMLKIEFDHCNYDYNPIDIIRSCVNESVYKN